MADSAPGNTAPDVRGEDAVFSRKPLEACAFVDATSTDHHGGSTTGTRDPGPDAPQPSGRTAAPNDFESLLFSDEELDMTPQPQRIPARTSTQGAMTLPGVQFEEEWERYSNDFSSDSDDEDMASRRLHIAMHPTAVAGENLPADVEENFMLSDHTSADRFFAQRGRRPAGRSPSSSSSHSSTSEAPSAFAVANNGFLPPSHRITTTATQSLSGSFGQLFLAAVGRRPAQEPVPEIWSFPGGFDDHEVRNAFIASTTSLESSTSPPVPALAATRTAERATEDAEEQGVSSLSLTPQRPDYAERPGPPPTVSPIPRDGSIDGHGVRDSQVSEPSLFNAWRFEPSMASPEWGSLNTSLTPLPFIPMRAVRASVPVPKAVPLVASSATPSVKTAASVPPERHGSPLLPVVQATSCPPSRAKDIRTGQRTSPAVLKAATKGTPRSPAAQPPAPVASLPTKAPVLSASNTPASVHAASPSATTASRTPRSTPVQPKPDAEDSKRSEPPAPPTPRTAAPTLPDITPTPRQVTPLTPPDEEPMPRQQLRQIGFPTTRPTTAALVALHRNRDATHHSPLCPLTFPVVPPPPAALATANAILSGSPFNGSLTAPQDLFQSERLRRAEQHRNASMATVRAKDTATNRLTPVKGTVEVDSSTEVVTLQRPIAAAIDTAPVIIEIPAPRTPPPTTARSPPSPPKAIPPLPDNTTTPTLTTATTSEDTAEVRPVAVQESPLRRPEPDSSSGFIRVRQPAHVTLRPSAIHQQQQTRRQIEQEAQAQREREKQERERLARQRSAAAQRMIEEVEQRLQERQRPASWNEKGAPVAPEALAVDPGTSDPLCNSSVRNIDGDMRTPERPLPSVPRSPARDIPVTFSDGDPQPPRDSNISFPFRFIVTTEDSLPSPQSLSTTTSETDDTTLQRRGSNIAVHGSELGDKAIMRRNADKACQTHPLYGDGLTENPIRAATAPSPSSSVSGRPPRAPLSPSRTDPDLPAQPQEPHSFSPATIRLRYKFPPLPLQPEQLAEEASDEDSEDVVCDKVLKRNNACRYLKALPQLGVLRAKGGVGSPSSGSSGESTSHPSVITGLSDASSGSGTGELPQGAPASSTHLPPGSPTARPPGRKAERTRHVTILDKPHRERSPALSSSLSTVPAPPALSASSPLLRQRQRERLEEEQARQREVLLRQVRDAEEADEGTGRGA